MVKVTFMPWKEIVIHEVIRYESLEKFIEQKITGLPKGIHLEPLLWTEGIVFSRSVMPPGPDVIKEQLQGIIHYQSLEYAPMEKYEASVSTQDGMVIPIVDATRTEALRAVAAALKKQ